MLTGSSVVLACLVATAPAFAEEQSVTAIGASLERVTPNDRHDNASIGRAVRDARAAGVAPALRDAKARGRLLAQAAGLTLGAVLAVDESAQTAPYYFIGPVNGTFGPGRYCGRQPRFVTRRDSRGRVHRVRHGTRRVCRFPNTLETRLAVTFAAAAAVDAAS